MTGDVIQAASFLKKELSPSFIQQLQSVNLDKTDQHFGLGMTVRNILRRSNTVFEDAWLDDHWFEILEKAIKNE